MPRTIQLTCPTARTSALLDDLRATSPLSLRLQRGGSIEPPGDVIELDVATPRLREVMRVADQHDLGEAGGVSMSTSVPLSIVSSEYAALTRESGGTSWEELELIMGQDSTMTADRTVVMLIAGVIAGVGIVSDTIHVVVGAMVIAPGFQPFARCVLGLVNRSNAWRGGLTDVARGYGALLLGATLAAVLALVFGGDALDDGGASYLADGTLVTYWTTTTWAGVSVGAVGALAGGVLVALNRTVLTAGVMVALALVPTASLVPMALLGARPDLAAAAGLRFLVEAGLVLVGTAAVFVVKLRLDRRSPTD
ncbi:DUF389 domain-containing protein [Nitriliruptoraceae bacterium ZYF776]|nr:DUF389 domain-containing protein [Profundirhabdus halotolerans]